MDGTRSGGDEVLLLLVVVVENVFGLFTLFPGLLTSFRQKIRIPLVKTYQLISKLCLYELKKYTFQHFKVFGVLGAEGPGPRDRSR